jgi:hypothetical protein
MKPARRGAYATGGSIEKLCASVNYLTLEWRKICKALCRQAQRDKEGMQMRALTLGIAVVVALGLIWSVAVMSNLVPLVGSEVTLAAVSRPAE